MSAVSDELVERCDRAEWQAVRGALVDSGALGVGAVLRDYEQLSDRVRRLRQRQMRGKLELLLPVIDEYRRSCGDGAPALTPRGEAVARTVAKSMLSIGLLIADSDADVGLIAGVIVDDLRGILPDDLYDPRIER